MIYLVYSEYQNNYDCIETNIILVTIDKIEAIKIAKEHLKKSDKYTSVSLEFWDNGIEQKSYFHYEIDRL